MALNLRTWLTTRLTGNGVLARLGRGAFWVSVGTVASQLLGVASSIIAARMLGSQKFGELSILRSTSDMVTLFAGLGLGVTANRYVALYRESDPAKAGQVIGMTSRVAWVSAAITAALVALLSNQVADLLHAPDLADEVKLLSAIMFCSTVAGAHSGILMGLESFRAQAKISAIAAVTLAPLVVAGVYVDGVRGAVVGMTLAAALSTTLLVRTTRRKTKQAQLKASFAWNSDQIAILKRFTLPALLSAGMVVPVFWAGNLILTYTSQGYHEMGLFAAANHWRQAILLLPNIMASAALPIMANLLGSKDGSGYQKVLRTSFAAVGMLTVLPALVLAALSPSILSLYGPGFSSASLTMVLLLAAAVLFAMSNVVGQILTSHGRMWLGLRLNACWAAAFLVSAWLLCPRFGSTGLAAAYAISYLLHLVLSAFVARLLIPATSLEASNGAQHV